MDKYVREDDDSGLDVAMILLAAVVILATAGFLAGYNAGIAHAMQEMQLNAETATGMITIMLDGKEYLHFM